MKWYKYVPELDSMDQGEEDGVDLGDRFEIYAYPLTIDEDESVSPVQDPGLRALPRAFGDGVGQAVQQAGKDLQGAADEIKAADDRLKAAGVRMNARHDTSSSLIFVDEFEQKERAIFAELEADNQLGKPKFNKMYGQQVDEAFTAILEGAEFSSPEAKIAFQEKLLKSRFELGDAAALKNTTALEQTHITLAKKVLRKYQVDPARGEEGFGEVIEGAKTMLKEQFGDTLSESSENKLIREVVINHLEPQLMAFLADGDVDAATALMEHPSVIEFLSAQQWRGQKRRIELTENKLIEAQVTNTLLDQLTADRLGKPIADLTPQEQFDGRNGHDATFKARELKEVAKIMFATDTPTTEQIQIAARTQHSIIDPMQKLKDAILVKDGEHLNLLRFEGRANAESNLRTIGLGIAALNAKGPDGKRAFLPGSLPQLRTSMSKLLRLFDVPQSQIDALPFKLGDASMSDLLSKSLANLALTQADKISRVTNMSIHLVREVWGTVENTPEALDLIFEISENAERRNLAIADLADAEANRLVNPDQAKGKDLEPFNVRLQELKDEWDDDFKERVKQRLSEIVSIKAQAAKAEEAKVAAAQVPEVSRDELESTVRKEIKRQEGFQKVVDEFFAQPVEDQDPKIAKKLKEEALENDFKAKELRKQIETLNNQDKKKAEEEPKDDRPFTESLIEDFRDHLGIKNKDKKTVEEKPKDDGTFFNKAKDDRTFTESLIEDFKDYFGIKNKDKKKAEEEPKDGRLRPESIIEDVKNHFSGEDKDKKTAEDDEIFLDKTLKKIKSSFSDEDEADKAAARFLQSSQDELMPMIFEAVKEQKAFNQKSASFYKRRVEDQDPETEEKLRKERLEKGFKAKELLKRFKTLQKKKAK